MNAREGGDQRPQSLLLSFLGIYVLDRHLAVYSGSVIEVFAKVGVSEEAVRSTLARMVKRGLLARHRRGRKMYFGLTARSAAVLTEGDHRVWRTGAVNRDWDGTWTMVGFSLPDSWRARRHTLRARLVWNGFGPLQNGLWIAPGEVDVPALLDDLDLTDHLRVLTARPAKPTDDANLIATAFDVDAIAAAYHAFLARWDVAHPRPEAPDDLARQLLLHTDWLQLVRSDPRLPAAHLPADWPAIRAEHVFQTLARAYQATATPLATTTLDTLPLH
ncbi:PaaX family transcriptional regulator [Pseudonocardia acaciae]|uniref:PaaX family transcriptional regulator n=1 Tax=Pseudonocardia acaciae TaxID=551276 RepID=UPI00048F0625|nr:PaaX family transcriptional regulator C-terminal domain-containing protein [Pseudonocardia acaciae]